FKELDNLIALQEHKIEKLKKLKEAYLSEMFPRKGEKYPRRRFAGFTEAWEECKLGEIAKLGSSKRVHRKDYVEKGIPFFRGLEISRLGDSAKLEDILYIDEEFYKELKNRYGVPEVGDILITAVGT